MISAFLLYALALDLAVLLSLVMSAKEMGRISVEQLSLAKLTDEFTEAGGGSLPPSARSEVLDTRVDVTLEGE